MDRRRRPALLAALLAGLSLAAARDAPALAEMRWLDPAADRAAALTTRPPECLAETTPAVEIGRAAFRSPLLLGGQAARAGLSCESCHRQGRGNPAFLFPGVSGAPGTADVTSSLLSSHRGNGVDDPRPIPDLGGPKSALNVSQAPGDPALAAFIRGLVVEEFDGPEPPAAVLEGLAAYVRALQPCDGPPKALRAADYLDDARRAARAGQAALAAGDAAAALVMVAAARARLGRIAERYPDDSAALPMLAAADGELAGIAAAMRARDARATARLAAVDERLAALAAPLARDETRSLFDPAQFSLPGRVP